MITINKKQGIALTPRGAVRITPRQMLVLQKLAKGEDVNTLRRGKSRTYVPVLIKRLRPRLKLIGLRIEEIDGSYKLVG